MTDINAHACPDCVAQTSVMTRESPAGAGREFVVGVLHSPTCPWFAAIVVEGETDATVATARGVVIHTRPTGPTGDV